MFPRRSWEVVPKPVQGEYTGGRQCAFAKGGYPVRPVAGALLKSLGIGAGFGLITGPVGAVQWLLAQHDLVDQLVALRAQAQQYPPPDGFVDATNFVRAYDWFWFGTALVNCGLMFTLSWLAAYMAGQTWRRRRGRGRGGMVVGMVAGLVAAALSGVIYFAEANVAIATSPAPTMTEGLLSCVFVLGIVYVGAMLPVVHAGASKGVYGYTPFSRDGHR